MLSKGLTKYNSVKQVDTFGDFKIRSRKYLSKGDIISFLGFVLFIYTTS